MMSDRLVTPCHPATEILVTHDQSAAIPTLAPMLAQMRAPSAVQGASWEAGALSPTSPDVRSVGNSRGGDLSETLARGELQN